MAQRGGRDISDLLESDDEFPDTYDDELPEIPAYLRDDRFTHVESVGRGDFYETPDLLQPKNPNKKPVESTTDSFPQKNILQQTSRNFGNRKVLISKGVLTKRDIYFVKSIAEYSTDVTLVWFVNYLFYNSVKPCQSSCLVENFMNRCSDGEVQPSSDYKKGYYLKLIVH